MDLTSVWHILYALLGVGFLIFVHELGHFLAAKKVGIRVDTFSIGFQPTIFGFRARFFAVKRGETEYVLGMVPFGGYVKMAGEELTDQKTGDDDEFASKGVGARAFVLVAGAAMNMIFGFLFFIWAFQWGVPFASPEIGSVAPGGPAWNAGLRAGDRIISVNSEPKNDFEEIHTSIVLSGLTQPIAFEVVRGDGEPFPVSITPEKDVARGMPTIGIRPPVSASVHGIEKGSPANLAGLERGDVIDEFLLTPAGAGAWSVPRELTFAQQWSIVQEFVGHHPDGAVSLRVRRDGKPMEIRVAIGRTDETLTQAGVLSQARTIYRIQPGSDAASVPIEAGWEITELNGEPIRNLSATVVARIAAGAPRMTLTTSTRESVEVETTALLGWLGGEITISDGNNTVTRVTPGGEAEKVGVEVGDLVLAFNEKPVHRESFDSIDPSRETHRIDWWDGEKRCTAPVKLTKPTLESLGLDLRQDPVTIGTVLPASPAADAGLLPGDQLLEVNGKPAVTFQVFRAAVAATRAAPWWNFWSSPAETVSLKVRRASGEEDLTITPRSHAPVLGFSLIPEQVILQKSIWGSVELGTQRTIAWTARIFLTLKALVMRDVDAKNLVGPIGIVHISKRVVGFGFGKFIFLLGLISINLGVFNLLPFPILDGGHLLFLVIEKIKGSPVSERIQGYAFTAAFILLICLALFVTFHDIRRMF